MSFDKHRAAIADLMEDNSVAIVYAGMPQHTNEYGYSEFTVNSSFFYLHGLEREGMIFLMSKCGGEVSEYLFIEEADPLAERWTGKMPTISEAAGVSGLPESKVLYLPSFTSRLNYLMARTKLEHVYFDTFRHDINDQPHYNLAMAQEFAAKCPGIAMHDLRNLLVPLRTVKDEEEIDRTRKAVAVTKNALEFVMKNLKPGMMEYEVQADFEYCCKKQGTKKLSFPTIAGSGYNGCMLHYETNDHVAEDGTLILLDLGAKYGNYCSDITRTYPVNGKFTERQRAYYDLVLKANYAVRDAAKPGMTLKDLNDIAKKILGEGLVEMGKIDSVDEVGKYYMHSVSHSIGIDCHDCTFMDMPMKAGWIISDEPGLYIDEECIGIRIEDDLLITEDGCEVLSADVIREADEIEAIMRGEYE